jgi:tripartite-type tricarboxylate transporter receptor subunit TctC
MRQLTTPDAGLRRALRGIACVLGLACATVLATPASYAQAWPSRPIKLIVPFGAGGATDVVARLVAQNLGERLGQPIVVENRPGAGAQLGTQMVAKEKPDGYTFLFGSSDGLSIVPQIRKKMPYDPIKDFTPIALVAHVPIVFIVNGKFPVNNLKELAAYAKSKPGAVRYGSAGNGSILHLANALLEVKTGTTMVHVPYKGGAQMMTDLAAGQIELAAATAELARRFPGQVRAIAQADTERHPLLPDVPTTTEDGFPDMLIASSFGLVGPAGLPPSIVARLAKELAVITETKQFQHRLVELGALSSFLPPEAFGRYIAEENRKWGQLVKDARLPPLD